jgi:hypothetical protein
MYAHGIAPEWLSENSEAAAAALSQLYGAGDTALFVSCPSGRNVRLASVLFESQVSSP